MHQHRRETLDQQRIGRSVVRRCADEKNASERTTPLAGTLSGRQIPGCETFSRSRGDARADTHAERDGSPCEVTAAREVVLGMAHRGRLNVLINVLGVKNRGSVQAEFAGSIKNIWVPAT